MEDGAHLSFKVPPPGIEFTLPSPKIGIESLPVVDPPWCPRHQTKDMEVTLNQEQQHVYCKKQIYHSTLLNLIICFLLVLETTGYCNKNAKKATN